MYERLTLENVLTYVCSFFFCTRKQLEQLTAENLFKLKKEYKPIGIKISKDSTISVFNVQDFAVLDKVILQCKITNGVKVVLQGEVSDLILKLGKPQVMKLPFNFHTYRNEHYSLSFEVKLQEYIQWAEKGFILARERSNISALYLQLKE